MLNLSHDLCGLLQARASSGRGASAHSKALSDLIITSLQRDQRFAGVPRLELELLLADVQRALDDLLFEETCDRIRLDEALDAVHRVWGD